MKFLALDGDLLKNQNLTPTDKMIVQFLFNLNKSGKIYFGDFSYLAKELGIKSDYCEKRFLFLESKNLIAKDSVGWSLKVPFWQIVNFEG